MSDSNLSAYPPAVVIHSLANARLALSRQRPVTLLSAPAAALYAGCLWWRELIAAAATECPAFLDCADAPGRAVEALRLGLRGIILNCEPGLFAAVTQIAQAQGCYGAGCRATGFGPGLAGLRAKAGCLAAGLTASFFGILRSIAQVCAGCRMTAPKRSFKRCEAPFGDENAGYSTG